MFRSAATKLAHNSTLPSLAPVLSGQSTKDLRPLQELINTSKVTATSFLKLSSDLNRSAEALRAWGQGEGDDLGSVFGASAVLLMEFGKALAAYANHLGRMRESLKNIRTREEALVEMKSRRKALFTKAEAAERKLAKMSPENKNLQAQTDLLNSLRDSIRTIDSEIMTEEAALGDLKRHQGRNVDGTIFGGLEEVGGKGVILGQIGKLITSELPEDVTQPGLPRAMYTAHARVDALVSQAQQALDGVVFSGVATSANYSLSPTLGSPGAYPPPNPAFMDSQYGLNSLQSNSNPPSPSASGPGSTFTGRDPPSYLGAAGPTGHFISPSEMSISTVGAATGSSFTGHHHTNSSSFDQRHHTMGSSDHRDQYGSTGMDDFGVRDGSQPGGPGGGRFATFPVKGGAGGGHQRGFTLRDDGPASSPSQGTQPLQEDESFSASVLGALGNGPRRPSLDVRPGTGTLGNRPTSPGGPRRPSLDVRRPSFDAPGRPSLDMSTESSAGLTDLGTATPSEEIAGEYVLPPRLRGLDPSTSSTGAEGGLPPLGASVISSDSSLDDSVDTHTKPDQPQTQRQTIFGQPGEGDDGLLAYMTGGSAHSSPTWDKTQHEQKDLDSQPKHVHFPTRASTVAIDIDKEMERRSREKDRGNEPPLSPEEEEKALNLAAAREVSRELDALNFQSNIGPKGSWSGSSFGSNSTSPAPSQPQPFARTTPSAATPSAAQPTTHSPPQSFSTPGTFGRGRSPSGGSMSRQPASSESGRQSPPQFASSYTTSNTVNRAPSPLMPPQALFGRRAASPQPQFDTGSPAPPIPPYAQPQHKPSGSWSSQHSWRGPPSPKDTVAPGGLPNPHINIPERDFSLSLDNYRTPPEGPTPSPQPKNLAASPLLGVGPFNKSTSSLNSTASGNVGGPSSPINPPPGAKTISAAAFRRPPPRIGSGAVDERMRLPSSPYPSSRLTGRQDSIGSTNEISNASLPPPSQPFAARPRAGSASSQRSYQQSGPPGRTPPAVNPRVSAVEPDDDYDYLSAYVTDGRESVAFDSSMPQGNLTGRNETGSPDQTDFGSLGNVKVVNGFSPGANGGYSQGNSWK